MFRIDQHGEDGWAVTLTDDGLRAGLVAAADGHEAVFVGDDLRHGYDLAVQWVAEALSYSRAVGELDALVAAAGDDVGDGLLPDRWVSDTGICFNEDTGDGRDFTNCAWSWRDPNVSLLPLMLQDVNDFGHFGAVLAGFMEELHDEAGTPQASGRFYSTDRGREARDLLLGGRHFGVSVDNVGGEVEWECIEEDEDGWCIDGIARFLSYIIGGLTMTGFPAFERARIVLEAAAGDEATDAVAAAARGFGNGMVAGITQQRARVVAAARAATAVLDRPAVDLAAPPRDWFETPEPQMGERYEPLGSLGDEWLVEQGNGALAMPLHIAPDGRVLGHIAYWGQCHVGYPGQCVTPPESASAYRHFHVGETVCADGSRIPTGSFTAGCDHALRHMRAPEAFDHYAHNGLSWASVRITNGEFGPWACGALHPDVTPEQVRVLRAGAMSGDWRRIERGGELELIAALAVTAPGFPIAREAITASGLRQAEAPRVRAYSVDGEQVSLVASCIVRRCPDCQRRASADASRLAAGDARPEDARLLVELQKMRRQLGVIERRTRPMIAASAQSIADEIRAARDTRSHAQRAIDRARGNRRG